MYSELLLKGYVDTHQVLGSVSCTFEMFPLYSDCPNATYSTAGELTHQGHCPAGYPAADHLQQVSQLAFLAADWLTTLGPIWSVSAVEVRTVKAAGHERKKPCMRGRTRPPVADTDSALSSPSAQDRRDQGFVWFPAKHFVPCVREQHIIDNEAVVTPTSWFGLQIHLCWAPSFSVVTGWTFCITRDEATMSVLNWWWANFSPKPAWKPSLSWDHCWGAADVSLMEPRVHHPWPKLTYKTFNMLLKLQ